MTRIKFVEYFFLNLLYSIKKNRFINIELKLITIISTKYFIFRHLTIIFTLSKYDLSKIIMTLKKLIVTFIDQKHEKSFTINCFC